MSTPTRGEGRAKLALVDEAPDTDRDPRSKRIELWIAGLLGVVAIITAFATYKAAHEDGDALTSFNAGVTLNDAANAHQNAAQQEYATDQATYIEWVKSKKEGDDDVAAYFRETLFSPELEKGVKWAEEGPEDAISPFQEDSPYNRPGWDQRAKLDKLAAVAFKKARAHGEDGDKYVLATVILSIALFLLGIAGVNRQFRVQRGLAVLASLVTVAGLVQILAVAL